MIAKMHLVISKFNTRLSKQYILGIQSFVLALVPCKRIGIWANTKLLRPKTFFTLFMYITPILNIHLGHYIYHTSCVLRSWR